MERLKNGELHISVRSLVEFMLRSGDLDNRMDGWKDSEAMLAGGRLHRKIQRVMGAAYHAEVPLSYRKEYPDYRIVVEGRADGIFIEDGIPVIDEIKSMKRNVLALREPIPVHEAQAKCYAYFYLLDLAHERGERDEAEEEESGLSGEASAVVQMTYCTQDTEETVRLRHSYRFSELADWFESMIDGYQIWVEFLYQHTKHRTETVKPLMFPFPYREGQRDMVVSVYHCLKKKKHLFVQAPTGVGKTMSALFPAVKAMGEGLAEKVFYLTAKTIARTVAEESFRILAGKGADLSFVTLTAKEKICTAEAAECSPVDCPRAKGHFDRINAAVYDVITHESWITRDVILAYSEKHQVCPFEFSLDISYWVDGIICDYNYVFDPSARLKRFFGDGVTGEYVFLIDEAHNMVERAREMYSAVLYKEQFLAAKKLIGTRSKSITKILESCNRIFLSYKKECETYKVLEDVGGLSLQLAKLAEQLAKFLEDNREFAERRQLLDFYFGVTEFADTCDYLDDGYEIYCEHDDDGFFIRLFCINPAKRMKEFLDKGNSAVFFSATLLPIHYYKELLTGNREEYAIYVPSPFDRSRRLLLAASDVSAKYTRRERGMFDRFASYILAVAEEKAGNYMVFCPSYKVLGEIRESVSAFLEQGDYSQTELLVQTAFMGEQEREQFLERFQEDRRHTLLAFCVLGGIFSEGIDLAEDRLIGVFIVGTGLPQVCSEREILKQYFDRNGENGFDYAYRYPGMNKVLQAAGRVIRTKEDVGIIALLDDRFRENANRALFPREWEDIRFVRLTQAGPLVRDFWRNAGKMTDFSSLGTCEK